MSMTLRSGALLRLRPIAVDAFLEQHLGTRLQGSILDSIDHISNTSDIVKLRIDQIRGQKNRCALGLLEDGNHVFAKFYSTTTLAQRNGLLQEISFLVDQRIRPLQFSSYNSPLEHEDQVDPPFIPQLLGLYELDPTLENDETCGRVILLPAIPSSFLTIKQLSAMDTLSPQTRRLLFTKASTALGTLHERGYLRGDISHGNFLFHVVDMLEESRVIIVDFEKASTSSKAAFDSALRGEKVSLLRLFLMHGATRKELLAAE